MNASSQKNNRRFLSLGLFTSLAIALFGAPLASQDPDGLDRTAKDLEFESKAIEEPPASELPFAQVFEEYKLRGVPEQISTSSAGAMGTLLCFALGLGLAKVITLRKT
jgi:cobalt/nickel transport protein